MAAKKTGFNLDKAISRISRPSVFDRIIKEVEAKEIPACFIESILVQYYDGSVVELRGNELTHPMPMNWNAPVEALQDSFKKMRDVRVFIDTSKLEEEVNNRIEMLLGKYC